MPIEIKELHIRVALTASSAPAAAAAKGDEREAIVAECVEQVMQILHGKTER